MRRKNYKKKLRLISKEVYFVNAFASRPRISSDYGHCFLECQYESRFAGASAVAGEICRVSRLRMPS